MITLATLAKASAQEVLDQVWRGLIKQNAKSNDGLGSCLYRGPNETKCAGGLLMSDEEAEKLPDHSWLTLVEDFGVNSNHQELIVDLQRIHDHQEVKDWPDCLAAMAERHGLEPTKADNK